MSESLVGYRVDGAVATMSLQRPDALNALNAAMRHALGCVMQRAEDDPAVRVVVFTAEGRGFCAGTDLKEPYNPPHATVEQFILCEYKPLLDAMAASSKIYVGGVAGAAAGIGMSFALNCDLLLMSKDAYLYPAFAPIGLVPDGGTTWQLVQAMGYKRALSALIEGRRLHAPECVAFGLANALLPQVGFGPAVHAYAEQLTRLAPLAVRYTKQLARRAVAASLDQVIRDEASIQNVTIASHDAQEAAAAFLERRMPKFEGR